MGDDTMKKSILIIIGALLIAFAMLPFVNASPEAIFQWDNSPEEGEKAYINFYQNFEHEYNFTIISDMVDECWVVNDYYDENKVVCRADNGLCKSIEPLNYKYIRCKTWEVYPVNSGEKAVLFYEYTDGMERQQGVYQTRELRVPAWEEKLVAFGPLMVALIAILVVIGIILVLIYFVGGSMVSWIREWSRPETSSYEELRGIKDQIGDKGEIFNNCIVIY